MVIAAVGGYWWSSKPGYNNEEEKVLAEKSPPVDTVTPTDSVETDTVRTYREVRVNETNYAYILASGIDPVKLSLIPNYTEKISSAAITKVNNCSAGINGGFYGLDDKPLGLRVINEQEISRKKTSNLFNGYVVIETDGRMSISGDEPTTTPKYALQTGPLLLLNGSIQNLSMASDKNARRMVMGVDGEGKAILISVFFAVSEDSGPLLSQLGEIVKSISDKEKLGMSAAVNLDGGSASAIYTPEVSLSEYNSVGSWWCVREG